ncbi:hypothetical protein GW750_05420 [bacterium]|nr:hypothetical protein [bacterium]
MRTLEYFRKSEKNYLEKYLEANTCFDRNMDFVSFEKAYTHLYFESKSLGEELQKHSKFTKEIIIEEII